MNTYVAEMTTRTAPDTFQYESWRHGGWYVLDVHYPSGAIGCVSRNYPDRKWRIACDPRPFDAAPTFKNRDDAARAEWELAEAEWEATRRKSAYALYRKVCEALPEDLCRDLSRFAHTDVVMRVAAHDVMTAERVSS